MARVEVNAIRNTIDPTRYTVLDVIFSLIMKSVGFINWKSIYNPKTRINFSSEDQLCFRPNCKDEMKAFVCYQGLRSEEISSNKLGSMGSVFRGTWHGKRAAFKHVKNDAIHVGIIYDLVSQNAKDMMELIMQKKLEHSNILKVIGCFRQQVDGQNEIIYVFPRCYCNLAEYVAEQPRKLSDLQPLFTQAVNGLIYISQQGFSHGDIKPANILITSKSGPPKINIADFGLVNRDGGTPIYMPPEGLYERVIEKPDVYSLGMTLFTVAFDIDLVMRLLYLPVKGSVSELRSAVAEFPLLSMISEMIAICPAKRPGLMNVREMFLTEFCMNPSGSNRPSTTYITTPIKVEILSPNNALFKFCNHHSNEDGIYLTDAFADRINLITPGNTEK